MTAIREYGATSGIGVLATFAYDDLGRRTSLVRGNGTVTAYGYDGASRLTSLSQDLAGTGADQSYAFANYSPAGEIGSRTASNDAYAWSGSYNVARPYATNGLNQYTASGSLSLSYDGRGNLTGDGTRSYIYGAENRLQWSNSVVPNPDPLGRMVQIYVNQTGTGTRFDHDGDAMISELSMSNALLRRYVFGPGEDEPLVWYEGSGTTDRRWLHADERGSIVAVSNASGGLIAIDSYDEYGIPAAANIGRFQYTGQAWLPELGLYDYKARLYSATLGRFLQTDPVGYDDGTNWYNYAHSNPVNGRDPSGLGNCPDPGGYTVQVAYTYADESGYNVVFVPNCGGVSSGGNGGSTFDGDGGTTVVTGTRDPSPTPTSVTSFPLDNLINSSSLTPTPQNGNVLTAQQGGKPGKGERGEAGKNPNPSKHGPKGAVGRPGYVRYPDRNGQYGKPQLPKPGDEQYGWKPKPGSNTMTTTDVLGGVAVVACVIIEPCGLIMVGSQ